MSGTSFARGEIWPIVQEAGSVAIGLHQARVAVWNALKESAMREQNATFRSWGSEALRHWLDRRGVPADHPSDARSEPYQLERIATCACSGYFHAGDAFDPFVFHAELPLRD